MGNLRGKALLKSLAILIFPVYLIAISFTGCSSSKPIDGKDHPVKIGLLLPYTGVFSSLGTNITQGFEMYLDETGWEVSNRKVVLLKEDCESSGQIGLQKTRKLVESDRIDILTGIVSSTVAYAIRDYVVANKIPLIIANAGATDLTREKGSKYIFRVSFANGQFEYPMGAYAYNTLNYKKIVVLAPDYAAGHEKATGFMDGFTAAGGEIVQEIYTKLGTVDYSPYLMQIKEADAVWVHFSGNDAICFVKQFEEFGLKAKFPLLSSGDTVDESFLPAQGDAAEGILSSKHYSAALDTAENKKFVEHFQKKYGIDANMFAEQGYVAAKVILTAIEKNNGSTSDTDKLLSTIRQIHFDAPRGPFKFDPSTQNVIFNTYVCKTEKKNGKLVNSVIDVFNNTSDRWNPEK